MANYYEQARSNYFKVKDRAAFQAFLERFGEAVELIEDEKDKNRVGFLAQEGIPSEWVVTDADGMEESVPVDFVSELAGHLADHEVMIVMGTGYEKMRYLVGFAVAINNRKERREVDLANIYELARQLTKKPKRITRAEY
jgi:hypothetical protein